jgi:hypothetical protein
MIHTRLRLALTLALSASAVVSRTASAQTAPTDTAPAPGADGPRGSGEAAAQPSGVPSGATVTVTLQPTVPSTATVAVGPAVADGVVAMPPVPIVPTYAVSEVAEAQRLERTWALFAEEARRVRMLGVGFDFGAAAAFAALGTGLLFLRPPAMPGPTPSEGLLLLPSIVSFVGAAAMVSAGIVTLLIESRPERWSRELRTELRSGARRPGAVVAAFEPRGVLEVANQQRNRRQ